MPSSGLFGFGLNDIHILHTDMTISFNGENVISIPNINNMTLNVGSHGMNCMKFSNSVVSNSYSESSSTVISLTTDRSGQEQVYHESRTVKKAPGGVKQTIHSVQDSSTGLQKMAIGRHIHEKGHVVEKKKNRYTGDEEENEEFINMDGDELDDFDQEWQDKTQGFNGCKSRSRKQPTRMHRQPGQLAITDGTSSSEHSGAAKKETGKYKCKAILPHKEDYRRSTPY